MADTRNGSTAGVAAQSHEDIFDFLARGDSEEFDWIIPGVLERGDRMIVTGREGSGKSILLEQIAVQCAAGIHPFTLDDIPAARVVVVDLEYSERELRRRFRDLVGRADGRIKPQQLIVEPLPCGLDLSTTAERDRFRGWVMNLEPDMLVIGPIYKMGSGDPESERDAKPLALFLDSIRSAGVSLIVEAHLPHASKDGRPIGTSMWRRWPELGVALMRGDQLKQWRPPRHEAPALPTSLVRGGEWPFSIPRRQRDDVWARIQTATAKLDKKPTYRDLAEMIGSNKDAVNRAVKEHADEWRERWTDE